MFLWAAGDFDRQGIRLTGSAAERYRRNGTVDVLYICARVCVSACTLPAKREC